MAPQNTDIAIVGAGPAGLSLAALLENHGYSYTIFERSREDTPPRGGSLDLHPSDGQRVMKEAGLEATFDKVARRGEATLHRVFNYHLEPLLSWGEGRDAPEIDRGALRNVLLSGVRPDRILYRKKLMKAERNDLGTIVLHFEDGTRASGLKMVVGADGVYSKVRPLISTTAVPIFLNQFYLWFKLYPTSEAFQNNSEMARFGPMVMMGPNSHIWNFLQGDDTYQVDFGLSGVQAFQEADRLDLSDPQAVKEFLLQERYFGNYHPWVRNLLTLLEPFPDGTIHRWVLNIMPPELIDWEPQEDVTLIGDSAHATTPFVGEGVNCAMRDACLLLEQLQKHGVGPMAIEEYEKQMKPSGIDLVTRSLKSGATFFNEDAGSSFMRVMSNPKQRLLGIGDKTFNVGEVEKLNGEQLIL